MSYLNKIFQSIPVKIPDRSGFDLSHEVLSTARTGTVVPVTHFEVLPGDTISMGSLMKVSLPPMAVPFMGRIDAELTAAFIPNRLLWNGWQAFITQNNGTTPSGTPGLDAGNGVYPSIGDSTPNVPFAVPMVQMNSNVGPGTLADYLGCGKSASTLFVNALPFLAYHKFCDDWIRDDNNIKPFFPKLFNTDYTLTTSDGGDLIFSAAEFSRQGRFLPFRAYTGSTTSNNSSASGGPVLNFSISSPNVQFDSQWPFDTRLGLGSLRQRCWAKDYFTTATTRPQAGAASSVMFDTSGSTGQFTIATLRAANALQKWMERNNIAGTEYGDQILSHFGVRPPDAVLNRSVLLGSVRTPVYVGSVENNTGTGSVESSGTRSPYGNVLGAAAGFGSAADKGSLIDNFTAKEHGFIMVFFTLIPHAYYDTGAIRSLLHRTVGDYAFPEFAGIGDQPIFQSELNVNNTDVSGIDRGNVFGYNQRYSEYKFLPDRVSGLLHDAESLSVYALKRTFDIGDQSLGASFLEIPTNFLDSVLGVSEDIGNFGCMIDVYFDCKALRVLPEYSLPHL